MNEKQFVVYCKKSDCRFGDVFFQKGQFYEAKMVHDLLIFSGEQKNLIQIEQPAHNEYFQEYFTLVLSMRPADSVFDEKSETKKARA